MRAISLIALCFSLFLLSACSSRESENEDRLETMHKVASERVKRLEDHLDKGLVRNAIILTRYANTLEAKKPEYGEIIDALAKDATTKGPLFQSLKTRLKNAKDDIPLAASANDGSYNELVDELNNIKIASAIDDFDLALTDPINVLADMSDGLLARVAAESKEKSRKTNNAENLGAGEQLVGNPNYGYWQQNSSGNSFWHWYGQYAFFSALFDRPIGYGYWSRHRNYSYYHDYGRSYYSSHRQKKKAYQTEARVRKKFKSDGKSFQSPYAKRKYGAKHKGSSLVKSPSKFGSASKYNKTKTASNSFSSKYKKSSGSKTTSKSSYNSRSTTSSRSFGFGGK